MINFKFSVLNFQFKVLILFLTFFFCFLSSSALAYPIDANTGIGKTLDFSKSINDTIKSAAGSGLSKTNFGGFNLSRIISSNSYGLSFNELINVKNFSTKDISGSVKAVAGLFIKLVITTLSVTIGVLRAILNTFF